MRTRCLAALISGLASLAPAWADTVHLTNGRTFENVIAETTATEVKIRMPDVSLSLPRSHVLRVEASDSAFAGYVRRKAEILGTGTAADWLALAQWARLHGQAQGAREAALAAAQLDPRLEGLAPLLREHGYVLDEQLDRWIPYADSMRRRGFELADGQWLSREEAEARQRAREEEMERRRVERAAVQAAQATQAVREAELALAHLELRQRLERTEPSVVVVSPPVYFFPSTWYGPSPSPPCDGCGREPDPPVTRPEPRDTWSSRSVFHVPGSLLPGSLGGSRGSHP